MVDQLFPLEVNPNTGEPFIRLPSPHENIIITPLRANDGERLASILAEPQVAEWMGGFNPTAEWLARTVSQGKAELQMLGNKTDEELTVVDFCPVRSIREVQEDGTEVLIGDIGIRRCTWSEIANEYERAQKVSKNNDRQAGDGEIVWQVGGMC
jgi:hypothetical protein